MALLNINSMILDSLSCSTLRELQDVHDMHWEGPNPFTEELAMRGHMGCGQYHPTAEAEASCDRRDQH